MSEKTIQLDIVSAECLLFAGKVKRVSVSGSMGDLGIEPGHAPLLSAIKPGIIHVVLPSDEDDYLYVSGGLLEVQPHCVTVLADSALRGHALDEAAARQAEAEARQRLAEASDKVDYARALSELTQVSAQLRLLKKIRQ